MELPSICQNVKFLNNPNALHHYLPNLLDEMEEWSINHSHPRTPAPAHTKGLAICLHSSRRAEISHFPAPFPAQVERNARQWSEIAHRQGV